MDKKIIIAIDGPAASGKSSLAKAVAKKLNITYIDTGAMYRACALYFLDNNIEINEENALKYVEKLHIDIKYIDLVMKVYLNGVDVTSKIRENRVSLATSDISKYNCIREKMVALQRKMGENTSVVLDGRDIGTVVFKNANLKIFLTASSDVRAIRRQGELKDKGTMLSLDEIKQDLIKRDIQDTTREVSPLKKADDAIEVDTSEYTVDETASVVIDLLKERVEIS